MNNTFGDLMSQYERARDVAKRFGTWDALDIFVKALITQVTPKVEKPLVKIHEYSFDDMGTPVLQEDSND